MTFLPIIERELRVAARRGTTHWSRFALTAVVSLIMVTYFMGRAGFPVTAQGRQAFEWLASAAFVLACAACTLTADTLSAERREGTLGLLFLTDLHPWDITLGKLASAGLGATYAGVAFIPLLMLPLLAGGVSGLEATRTGLALLMVLLLALAAGLAVSARELERMVALRRAAFWVAGTVILPVLPAWFGTMRPLAQAPLALAAIPLLVRMVRRWAKAREMDQAHGLRRTVLLILGGLVLPALAGWFGLSSLVAWIGLLSPLTLVLHAQDTAYAAAPVEFWVSLVVQGLHVAALLRFAGQGVRGSLIESVLPLQSPLRPEPKEPELYSWDPFSNASYLLANPPAPPKPPPRRPFNEAQPLEWLVMRHRGQQKVCWIAAWLLIVSSQFGFVLQHLRLFTAGGPTPQIWYLLSHLSWVGKALVAWVACRFFFEARRTGELELLLTTPVGAQTLVTAHWAAMKRLLRGPLVLVFVTFVLPTGIVFLASLGGGAGNLASFEIYSALYALFRPLELLLIVFATTWLGAWLGLTARRLFNAIALTVAMTAGMTMLIHLLWQFSFPLFSMSGAAPSMGRVVWSFGSFLVSYAALLAMTYWARQRLLRGALAEPMPLDWRHEAQIVLGGIGALRRAGRR